MTGYSMTCLRAGWALCSILAAVSAADAKPPVDIGARLELFVDDFLIDSMSGGAERRLHHPQPREVVLELEKPWEEEMQYFTAIQDGGGVRLYYSARPPWSRRSEEAACVAESEDGIHFTRPTLGLFDYQGSAETNMVLRWGQAGHHFTPFVDTNPAAPPEARYKGIGALGPLRGFSSPDGIHWERVEDSDLPEGHTDSQNVAFWDTQREKYVAYARHWVREPGRRLRLIRRAESDDFVNWTDAGLVEFTDDREEHMYTSGIQPYFRAPHIYIGLANRRVESRDGIARIRPTHRPQTHSHIRDGLHDTILMSSRDGKVFDRWEEAFLGGDTDIENWGDRNYYIAWGMARLAPEEISLYWTEHRRYHTNRLRRGTVRTDGFVSVYAGAEGGEMVTRPLVFSGDRLVVNYATSATGEMRFELLGEDGAPIPGFSLGESETLFGNDIERVVAWRQGPDAGGSDLAALRGRPVRLRVALKDAHLYSIRFDREADIRRRLEGVRAEAADAFAGDADRFGLRRRERLRTDIERLDELLADDEARLQLAIDVSYQLIRSLAEHRQARRVAARAREALKAADALEEAQAGFGAAYRVAAALAADRLGEALADETASTDHVETLALRVVGAVKDAEAARAARAQAQEGAALADEAVRQPADGFGVPLRNEIARRRDALRAALAKPDGTLSEARKATRHLAEAIEAFREPTRFPALMPAEADGTPAVFSVGSRAEWEQGLLINARADGEGLTLAEDTPVRFGGQGAYLQRPAFDALTPEAVTVEAWIKLDEDLGDVPVLMVGPELPRGINRRRTEHAYALWLEGLRPRFSLGSEDAGEASRADADQAVEVGAWQHIAGQFDGNEARVFVNGRLAGSTEFSGAIDTHWAEALRIGGRFPSPNVRWFEGQIRDARVWTVARTEREIRDSMGGDLAGDADGLAGRWVWGRRPGEGDTVFDASPAGNHANLSGAEWALPQGVWLSNPVSFPGASSVARSMIEWSEATEGDPAQASAQVLIGLSDSEETLPAKWRQAVPGEPVPFVEPGADLTGKRVWIKAVLCRNDPGASVRIERLRLSIE